MHHKELKILEVKEEDGGQRFRAIFEVPGDRYGQSYPKRKSHTFPYRDSFFETVDEQKDLKRFEQILIDTYMQDKNHDEEDNADSKDLQNVKKEVEGRKFSET